MAQEAQDMHDSTPAELKQAADEVARSGEPREVRAEGKALTIALRDGPRPPRRRKRGRLFTLDDPLSKIAGIAKRTGVDDVSSNVDKYLMSACEEEYLSKLAARGQRRG